MPHRSDRQLALDYTAGDTRAFKVIVQRHRQRMFYVARSYVGNDHDAQDIVQEALLRASRSLDTYRGDAKLSTWLHTTVVNAAKDHQRRLAKRHTALSYDDEDRVSKDANYALAHDPTPTLDYYMALRQAMAQLPVAQRKALWLIDVQGMSVETAADQLGVKPGTVKSRRHRARESVAAAIGL